MQLFWKHRSARRWNYFPEMEVTCIYCKHYPTFKFWNETRVRQGVWIPVRASLQPEVSSAAKAHSRPPACLRPEKTLLSLDHFVTCFRLGGGKLHLHRRGLLISVTHWPLAWGEAEVQAPFFTQTQETAANHLKAKGLGSVQDHVPCGLYKTATSDGRNFSQLKVRKNINGYWMAWVFLECQSTKIFLQGEEHGESFLAVYCCPYGQQTLISKPPQPCAQSRTTV